MTDVRREQKRRARKRWLRTPKGIASKLYKRMTDNSKARGHIPPDFDRVELYEWLIKQPNFETLYAAWIDSGYDVQIKPSVDRIKNKLPYTFSNMQLMTVYENSCKGGKEWATEYKSNNPDLVTNQELKNLELELAYLHKIVNY